MSRILVVALSGLLACTGVNDPEKVGDGKGDNPDSLADCGYQSPMPLGTASFDEARELSGLVASREHPALLWTHNDGDEPILFAIDRDGTLRREVRLDSPAHDWEDLAIGPGPRDGLDYLYIADTGDNDLERRRVQVIRVAEPDPDGGAIAPVEVFELEYGDGDPHDAEAMFVDPVDGRLYIVTKRTDHDDRKSKLFASRGPLAAGGGDVEMIRLVTEKKAPHLDGVWVGADISPTGDEIVLVRDKGANLVFSRAPNQLIEDALASEPCAAPRSPGHQEAVAFSSAGGGFYMVPEGKDAVVTFAAAEAVCPSFDITSVAVEAPLAVEVSGVVASTRQPELFWAVNDPGDGDRDVVVAIDRDGRQRGAVRLAGAVNIDWEDIAASDGFLYVADIGDNDADRDELTIYRFAEPALSELAADRIDSATFETIELAYADGARRDAESLVVDPATGDLVVFSRRRKKDEPTTVFIARAPIEPGELHLLERESERDLGGPATSADVSADGQRLVIRLRGDGNVVATRHPDQTIAELVASGCRGPGGSADHDSIAIDGDGYLILSEASPAEMLLASPH